MRKTISALVGIGACFFAADGSAQKLDWQVFTEPFVSQAHAQDVDWQKVDKTLGRKPVFAGDVHRYGFPRTDLTVTLDGVTIKPAGAWRLGRVQASAGRRHDHGRHGAAGVRGQSGHVETDGERS